MAAKDSRSAVHALSISNEPRGSEVWGGSHQDDVTVQMTQLVSVQFVQLRPRMQMISIDRVECQSTVRRCYCGWPWWSRPGLMGVSPTPHCLDHLSHEQRPPTTGWEFSCCLEIMRLEECTDARRVQSARTPRATPRPTPANQARRKRRPAHQSSTPSIKMGGWDLVSGRSRIGENLPDP